MMVPQWQGGAAIMYLMGLIIQRHTLSNIPVGNRFPFKALVIEPTTILNSFPVMRNLVALYACKKHSIIFI